MTKYILAAIAFLGLATTASAQLTILDQPSADVMDKGQVYARIDGSYQPTTAVSTLTPNTMFGVGHGLELDLNAENISHPDSQQIAIVPGFKYILSHRVDPRNEVSNTLFVGDKIPVPIVNTRYAVGNYVYLGDAVNFEGLGRITAGVWNSQSYEDRGNRTGAFLGYEKNLSYSNKYLAAARPTTTLAFDWQSGNGYDGGLTAGLMIFPTDRWMIIPGYKIGNRKVTDGNHEAKLYVGYRF